MCIIKILLWSRSEWISFKFFNLNGLMMCRYIILSHVTPALQYFLISHWNDGDKKTREFRLRINENAHSHENSSRFDSETMLNKTYNYKYWQCVCIQPFKLIFNLIRNYNTRWMSWNWAYIWCTSDRKFLFLSCV